MNLTTTTKSLTAVLLAGALISVYVPDNCFASAQGHAALQGGQGAPPASGGSGLAVRVATHPDEAQANVIKDDLIKEGFTLAKVQRAAQGQYEVVIPEIASRAQAEGVVADLIKSGYATSVEIVTPGVSPMAGLPSAAAEKVYRVEVAQFDSAEQATQASEVLRAESFVNFDIEEASGKHLLMVGTFRNEADAIQLVSEVKEAGFALATVVSRERMGGQTTGAQADLSALPADQQAPTREILEMAEKVANGQATSAEMQQLRSRIQQLNQSQRNILNQQEQNRAQEQSLAVKVFPLYREFDQALKNKNYDQAESILAQVRQIDPDNTHLARRTEVLQRERTGTSAAAPPGATGTIADPEAVQKTLNEARAAELSGNRPEARAKYQAVLAMDPANVEAKGKVAELSAPLATGAPADAAATEPAKGLDPKLLYGGGGLLALIILFLVWKKLSGRKDEPISTGMPAATNQYNFDVNAGDPLAESTAATTDFSAGSMSTQFDTPGLAGAGLGSGGMDNFSSIPVITADDEEEAPAPKPRKPVPAAPAEPESESVSLDDLGIDMSAVGTTDDSVALDTPEAPAQDDSVVSINLDEEAPFSDSRTYLSQTPVDIPSAPAPAASKSADDDLEALLKGTFAGGAQDEVAPKPVPDSGVDLSFAETAGPAVVFEESFDNEPTGSTPANWRGEYDYATLSITESDEPGHAKCLVFSKTEGVGSATYHLTFPNASGRVTAEFDIRCDEKNKFLLGFYLEKDEDFKQSVHTIIHQLDPSSPASLRLQGEATPYSMGTWKHVRFEVDLVAGTTTGYLDGEKVVDSAVLASPPEYLNTLSIRDNLATTGTLYLDNIRITEG